MISTVPLNLGVEKFIVQLELRYIIRRNTIDYCLGVDILSTARQVGSIYL